MKLFRRTSIKMSFFDIITNSSGTEFVQPNLNFRFKRKKRSIPFFLFPVNKVSSPNTASSVTFVLVFVVDVNKATSISPCQRFWSRINS